MDERTYTGPDDVTEESFSHIGWNQPQHENQLYTDRMVCDALNMIGRLLVQIRDEARAK